MVSCLTCPECYRTEKNCVPELNEYALRKYILEDSTRANRKIIKYLLYIGINDNDIVYNKEFIHALYEDVLEFNNTLFDCNKIYDLYNELYINEYILK